MILDIITVNDEVVGTDPLHTECKEVALDDLKERNEYYAELVLNMLDTAKNINALGLAANQIGACLRIFVLTDGSIAMINPVIVARAGMVTSHEEGCLSVPGERFNIRRAKRVVARGYDLDGNEFTLRPKNKLTAFAIQHEIDHLNGLTLKDLGKKVM